MKAIYFLCMMPVAIFASPLGKTHFIMGEPTQVVVPVVSAPALPNLQIFFVPDDNVRHELLRFINAERQAIYLAVFMITDPEVANALCAARKRGVRVEAITDVGCLKDRASKIEQLSKGGCLVYIYNPTVATKKGVSLMHHKFALFMDTSRVWTGSYNFTKAANNCNRENVITFIDKQACNKFLDQFKKLKSQSYEYTREKIVST